MKETCYTCSDGRTLVPAKKLIHIGNATIINPNTEQYAKVGAYPLMASQAVPDAPEGKVAVFDGYELADGAWRRKYVFEDAPPPVPRTFSKLKIVAALMQANVWEQVKQYIIDAGLYDLYLAAQDFREDNEYFLQGKTVLMSQLGWDNAQVENILAASEVQ